MYVYSAYPSILKFFIIVEAFTSLSLTNMKNVNCSSPNYFYIFKKSYSSHQLSALIRQLSDLYRTFAASYLMLLQFFDAKIFTSDATQPNKRQKDLTHSRV